MRSCASSAWLRCSAPAVGVGRRASPIRLRAVVIAVSRCLTRSRRLLASSRVWVTAWMSLGSTRAQVASVRIAASRPSAWLSGTLARKRVAWSNAAWRSLGFEPWASRMLRVSCSTQSTQQPSSQAASMLISGCAFEQVGHVLVLGVEMRRGGWRGAGAVSARRSDRVAVRQAWSPAASWSASSQAWRTPWRERARQVALPGARPAERDRRVDDRGRASRARRGRLRRSRPRRPWSRGRGRAEPGGAHRACRGSARARERRGWCCVPRWSRRRRTGRARRQRCGRECVSRRARPRRRSRRARVRRGRVAARPRSDVARRPRAPSIASSCVMPRDSR